MRAQISNTSLGYVVEVYMESGVIYDYGRWHPIINFGDRQSDAIEFVEWHFENLDLSFIKRRIADYDPNNLYKIEIKSGKIVKQ